MIKWIILTLAFFAAASQMQPEQPNQNSEQFLNRRFALAIGANNGGPSRPALRYALDDARTMIKVMEDLGGIQSGDGYLLPQPTRNGFFSEMKRLTERIDQARKQYRRVELFVYYSGHSDEESLFLGGERVSYREFRDIITAVDADVRIAILDSCASGAFIQQKGVITRSPFLIDTAYDMKGYAFITSSSANEAAQESKRIRGSFFTHNLVAGMRGAADMNLDNRITLTEAYQFAFDATLQQTEKTLHGPQHPNYNIQMSGTGDVVITDISQGAALLVLGRDIGGKVYIHNHENVLIVELNKTAGRELTIGLDEGPYRIILISEQSIFETRLSLTLNQPFRLERKKFEKVEKISSRRRGDLFIPKTGDERKGNWKLIFLGGIARTSPHDLNLRPRFDLDRTRFLLNQRFEYQRQQGEFSFYTNQESGSLNPVKISKQGEIRIQRQLNERFALFLGCRFLSGKRDSTYENSSVIIEKNGPQYFFKSINPEYSLGLSGVEPAIGLSAGYPIGRRLRWEARVAAGIMFANCRYFAVWKDFPQTDQGEIIIDEYSFSGRMEEKGSGIGAAFNGALALEWKLKSNSGILLEIGYSYRKIGRLSGSGWDERDGVEKSWTGEWGMKELILEYPWGTFSGVFPSNYWLEDHLKRRVRGFSLDLSGAEFNIGYCIRF